MDATELLLAKALEYELMAVSLADASALSEANGPAVLGFTVVAIVLREVADVFEEAAATAPELAASPSKSAVHSHARVFPNEA